MDRRNLYRRGLARDRVVVERLGISEVMLPAVRGLGLSAMNPAPRVSEAMETWSFFELYLAAYWALGVDAAEALAK